MSKFNVGDEVRVVKSREDDSYTTKKLIGKEGVVIETGGIYGYSVRFANTEWSFYPEEIEAVATTPEARLEQAKALVAELEQNIADAKPKAENIPWGSVVRLNDDTSIYFVKVSGNRWFANWGNVEYDNAEIASRGIAEIIREGVE
jgi:ABC-type Fe3+-hydroxamate transport system substrate-binding protein